MVLSGAEVSQERLRLELESMLKSSWGAAIGPYALERVLQTVVVKRVSAGMWPQRSISPFRSNRSAALRGSTSTTRVCPTSWRSRTKGFSSTAPGPRLRQGNDPATVAERRGVDRTQRGQRVVLRRQGNRGGFRPGRVPGSVFGVKAWQRADREQGRQAFGRRSSVDRIESLARNQSGRSRRQSPGDRRLGERCHARGKQHRQSLSFA